MKPESTPKVASSKMTALQSPVGLRSVVSYLVVFFIAASAVIFLFDKGQDQPQLQTVIEHQGVKVKEAAAEHDDQQLRGSEAEVQSRPELQDSGEECNWSMGRWVYDNESRPLYSGLKCAFIFPEVACDKYGRKDVMYQHWRWQPHGCDLPRFNATELLEKMRNKRLVFVGDSVNRNQWVSLVCMVEASIPDARLKTRIFNDSLISFKALVWSRLITHLQASLL